jgi:hypothetical protein
VQVAGHSIGQVKGQGSSNKVNRRVNMLSGTRVKVINDNSKVIGKRYVGFISLSGFYCD